MSPYHSPLDPQIRLARAEVARASRSYSHADPEKVAAARRLLENNRIFKARILEIVAAAPPLTQSQVDVIAALLRPTDGE